jgi:hypothetical protein
MEILKNNPVYLKYKQTAYSTPTIATVLADLDAITSISFETLPLIKFLTLLFNLKTREDMETTLDTIQSNTLGRVYQDWIHNPTMYTPAEVKINLGDYAPHKTELTLSSGAIAATAIYAPGAGKKPVALWLSLGTNNTTNPTTTSYTFTITEETSGDVIQAFTATGSQLGRYKRPIFWIGTTADKDINMAVSGGNAAEKIFVTLAAGRY